MKKNESKREEKQNKAKPSKSKQNKTKQPENISFWVCGSFQGAELGMEAQGGLRPAARRPAPSSVACRARPRRERLVRCVQGSVWLLTVTAAEAAFSAARCSVAAFHGAQRTFLPFTPGVWSEARSCFCPEGRPARFLSTMALPPASARRSPSRVPSAFATGLDSAPGATGTPALNVFSHLRKIIVF